MSIGILMIESVCIVQVCDLSGYLLIPDFLERGKITIKKIKDFACETKPLDIYSYLKWCRKSVKLYNLTFCNSIGFVYLHEKRELIPTFQYFSFLYNLIIDCVNKIAI